MFDVKIGMVTLTVHRVVRRRDGGLDAHVSHRGAALDWRVPFRSVSDFVDHLA